RGTNAVYDTTNGPPFNGPSGPARNNALDLRASYARRLDSGDVLIVNGYAGTIRGDEVAPDNFQNRVAFNGEVLQISGLIDGGAVNPANPNVNPGFSFSKTNLGFGTLSIQFELPPVT